MENNEQPQLPKNVSLPTATVNEILAVFSQMPYNQVAAMITKIQQEVRPLPDAPDQIPGPPDKSPVVDEKPAPIESN